LGSVAKLQIALAMNEIIGPVRLGITVSVTPKVADFSRSFQATRDLEAQIVRRARRQARVLSGSVQSAKASAISKLRNMSPLLDGLLKGADETAPDGIYRIYKIATPSYVCVLPTFTYLRRFSC
jgi:hypothetical protein